MQLFIRNIFKFNFEWKDQRWSTCWAVKKKNNTYESAATHYTVSANAKASKMMPRVYIRKNYVGISRYCVRRRFQ